MDTEIVVSRKAAQDTADLIQEYLTEGGTGFNDDALAEMLVALIGTDHIIIGE